MPDTVKFVQITVGQWRGNDGKLSYSVIGLSNEGEAYQYSRTKDYWSKLSNRTDEIRSQPRQRQQDDEPF